jgi:tachykinin receptor 3
MFQAVTSQSYTQHVFLSFFWLAMANSAVNPVIYFLMNAK